MRIVFGAWWFFTTPQRAVGPPPGPLNQLFFEKLKAIELAFSVRGAFQLYWKIFVLLRMNGSVEDRPFGIKTLF
jgi:hypothetical protein